MNPLHYACVDASGRPRVDFDACTTNEALAAYEYTKRPLGSFGQFEILNPAGDVVFSGRSYEVHAWLRERHEGKSVAS